MVFSLECEQNKLQKKYDAINKNVKILAEKLSFDAFVDVVQTKTPALIKHIEDSVSDTLIKSILTENEQHISETISSFAGYKFTSNNFRKLKKDLDTAFPINMLINSFKMLNKELDKFLKTTTETSNGSLILSDIRKNLYVVENNNQAQREETKKIIRQIKKTLSEFSIPQEAKEKKHNH